MSVLDQRDRLGRQGWLGRAALPATVASAGLAIVLAVVLVYEAQLIARHHGSWLFDLAAGLLVCAAALARGRSCALAAAAGLTVAGAAELAAWLWHLPAQPDAAADLALLVLIGSAARRLPPRLVVAVAVAGAVVVAGTIERYLVFISAGIPSSLAATRLMGLGWGAALAIGLWLRLMDGRRQATLEAVRRAERLDLARELHDAAAHHITGIVIQAQAARLAAGQHPGRLADALAGIEAAGSDALGSLRRVIGLLRDEDGDDGAGVAPGPGELSELVSRFAARIPGGGCDVRLQLPDGPADSGWPPEVTTTVYRVVQEALTNIARHAPAARSVTVIVGHDQGAVSVQVTDDAPAAGAARFPHASGYGLLGMRERVERLGGELTAGPAAGAGWSVAATVPLPGGSTAAAARRGAVTAAAPPGSAAAPAVAGPAAPARQPAAGAAVPGPA
ncbi:MAG TPA: histidine kinase [Streptosporangiaceae bacterium]|nr:histidine kinase [Streptosporangiaceae bacterium]